MKDFIDKQTDDLHRNEEERKSIENIAYPICPINMYFEGDENKFDASKCDFVLDIRSCTEACKKKEEKQNNEISNNGMRQFGRGATRDSDDHPEKPSYYKALSPIVLREYVKYLGRHRTMPDGSKRDWDNWKCGIPIDVYMDSILRHVMAIWLIQHGYKSYDNHGEVTLKDSLNGIMFNTTGFLHEILEAEVRRIEEIDI